MRIIYCVAALLFCSALCLGEEEAATLVKGAVERHSAFVSGRIKYDLHTNPKRMSGDRKSDWSLEFVFSDTRWVRLVQGHPGFECSTDGMYFEYIEFPRRGSVVPYRNLRIHWEAKDYEKVLGLSKDPKFAGSFWFPKQVPAVSECRSRFTLTGSKTIGGIPTQCCEIDLPSQDIVLKTLVVTGIRGPGRLRLYIARELGFVMPLIECLDAEGVVCQTYHASGFAEVVPGLWLPNAVRMIILEPVKRDTVEFEADYRNIEYESVNEQLPAADFIFSLQPGTEISDPREERSRVLKQGCTTRDLQLGAKPW